MSYRLKNRLVVPPAPGFLYKQAETGSEFDGGSVEGTVAKVIQHRITNNLPRQSEAEVAEDVEDQICKRAGSQWCRNMAAESWGFTLDWNTIVAGTKTLFLEAFRVAKGGNPWCSQDEAEERAATCVKCFANQRGGGCASCGFMDQVRGLIGETCSHVQTAYDDRLQTCLVCGCLLKCKVHYPAEVIKAGMSDRQRRAYADIPECWINRI